MTKTQTKWLGLLALIVVSVFLLYPTVNWYQLDPLERAKLEAQRERPKWLVNLGLDLKGGTHMVMELQVDKLDPKTPLREAMTQAIEILLVRRRTIRVPHLCAQFAANSTLLRLLPENRLRPGPGIRGSPSLPRRPSRPCRSPPSDRPSPATPRASSRPPSDP